MIVTRPAELRNNQKKYFAEAYSGETIVVSRPRGENVVVMSEKEYNTLQMKKRILEYAIRLYSGGGSENTDDIPGEYREMLSMIEKMKESIDKGRD